MRNGSAAHPQVCSSPLSHYVYLALTVLKRAVSFPCVRVTPSTSSAHACITIRFVEHRIGDRRIVRLIRKWLAAGVLEDGQLIETEEGTPQGALTIAPAAIRRAPRFSFSYRLDEAAHLSRRPTASSAFRERVLLAVATSLECRGGLSERRLADRRKVKRVKRPALRPSLSSLLSPITAIFLGLHHG